MCVCVCVCVRVCVCVCACVRVGRKESYALAQHVGCSCVGGTMRVDKGCTPYRVGSHIGRVLIECGSAKTTLKDLDQVEHKTWTCT